MDNAYELMKKIREKPGLYLGEKSLTRLNFFIFGYEHKEQELGLQLTNEIAGFDEFTREKYGDKMTLNCWERVLRNTDSEEVAFDKFFELLDEFMAKKQQ